ncbi:hypothetical protein B0H65DRAFT_569611 [Neurospora tetraspora]|uniref:Uncharacterized protein n=1 Tax=Neurospora tetraspora TaxID=94610 RepID=A0AAE0JN28_9PEZI|nr:hypothetical protein B0H65DRAFT_569611 [Neurospora tetraspora]
MPSMNRMSTNSEPLAAVRVPAAAAPPAAGYLASFLRMYPSETNSDLVHSSRGVKRKREEEEEEEQEEQQQEEEEEKEESLEESLSKVCDRVWQEVREEQQQQEELDKEIEELERKIEAQEQEYQERFGDINEYTQWQRWREAVRKAAEEYKAGEGRVKKAEKRHRGCWEMRRIWP